MSMSRFAAGLGAAALVAAMSLPVTAMAAPAHQPTAAKSANTDISSARRGYAHAYRGGYRHYGYRGGYRGYPAYGYGGGYGGYGPYYGGPHAYVALPFLGVSIW